MSKEQGARASRYDAIIATLVGVSALFVSGYTAYVQRQQVRAAVWPILEYDTSNGPMIRFTIDNKGVGPAIVRHVTVTVDGQPVRDWQVAMRKLLGPGSYKLSESTLSQHVFSAGESVDVFIPHDAEGNPLTLERGGPLWDRLDRDRYRVAVEICYCSTLNDCWILRGGGNPIRNTITAARTCSDESATSFQQ